MDENNPAVGEVVVRRAARRAVLTDRDKQLAAFLSIARYLSTAQVKWLVFRETELDNARKRLLRLSGLWKASKTRPTKAGVNENFDPPILRRHTYRTFDGEIVEAWGLTDIGYFVAEQVLRTPVRIPRTDVSAQFMEHSIALSGLFVALADPSQPLPNVSGSESKQMLRGTDGMPAIDGRFARAEALPFRWHTSEFSRLPWSEYDRKTGKRFEKVIQPDGVLEMDGRRFFLECEMGTHSIQGNENKPGATLAKAERYEKYLHHVADPKTGQSFYQQAFEDGLPAEVLFLVTNEGRRESVRAALGKWSRGARRLAVKVLTLDEAAHALISGRKAVTNQAKVERSPSISELAALKAFYNAVVAPIKQARAAARAAQRPVPNYPEGTDLVAGYLKKMVPGREGGEP